MTDSLGQSHFRRLTAMVEELKQHDRVFISRWAYGVGASDAQLAIAEETIGAKLDPVIADFYREANGVCLVWFDREGETYEYNDKAKQTYSDFPPPVWALEEVAPIDGGLYFAPIEQVFAYPMFDYYCDTPDPLRVYGEDTDRQALAERIYPFDMPGSFYHGAYMIKKGCGSPEVLIVDDHSCLTDCYLTDFASYMECILSTWAHVHTRMRHYLAGAIRRERTPNPRGDGVPYWQSHSIPLGSLLGSS